MKHEESNLQIACVRWFRYEYPQLAPLLFHVPNGGHRNTRHAVWLKKEGVQAGVADLILLYPSKTHASLCIEMKGKKGRLNSKQKEWGAHASQAGNRYVVCNSFEGFVSIIKSHLNDVT